MSIFNRVARRKFRQRNRENGPESHEMLSKLAILANQCVLRLISGQYTTRKLAMFGPNTSTRQRHPIDKDTVKKVELEKSRQLRHGVERYLGLDTASRESTLLEDSKQLVSPGHAKAPKPLCGKPPCSYKRYSEHQQETDLGERFDPARRPSTPVAWATGGAYKRLPRHSTRIRTTKVQQPVTIPPCYPSGIDYWLGGFWDDNSACQARGTPVLNLVPPPEDGEDVGSGKQLADIWSRPSPSPHDASDKSLLYGNRYERPRERSKRQASSTDSSACTGDKASMDRTFSVPLYVVNRDGGNDSGVQGDEAQVLQEDPVGVASPIASDYLTRAKEYPPLTYDGEEWGDELVDSSHYLGTVDEDYRRSTYYDDPTQLAVKYNTYFCY
ncbi:hypothetical protein PpBr36_03688 [Pyricularia pennisetigena]|uniref:hypothetical protein n=1 Tax=Pyricularia pennisetigena TaxID=1578925 RepID=UPI0011512D20|nr:hypothetical protein PpBr36_03688 [Pyricularia pennisetigena]TLS31596.1 hypothetical protein PpBr36_03688 [Pyricularia pennisetigena]